MRQYKIWNNALGWCTFLVAALTYCLTVEPTASFWDCPEFILSGNKLEIGHPPGAPFFMLTANFFSMFAGPSDVAYMVNIMSALLSAAGILFMFWSITHLTRKIIVGNSKVITKSQMVTIFASGIVGALAYTWSDTYWFSAVEGEVYGYSSLFTAVVFWLILKWEDNADDPRSDRWLILIAYLVGLSIGVHLLNLLCIPAIVLVVYYKKKPNATFKGSMLALVASALIVMVVLYGIVPGVVKVGGWFELLFVNVLGMPFNTGLYIYILLLFATLIAGIICTEKGKSQTLIASLFTIAIALLGVPFYGNGFYGNGFFGSHSANVVMSILIAICVLGAIFYIGIRHKTVYTGKSITKKYTVSRRGFNTSFLCLLLIMVGYSSYTLIVVRSSANTPMDQNSPEDIFTLGSYLNREQYGSRPLLYGECFDAELKRDENGNVVSKKTSPIYIRTEKQNPGDPDRYEIIDWNKEYQYVQNMFFPRMYSPDHAAEYERWGGKITKTVRAKYSNKEIKVPTQMNNLRFFMNYQVNHMYWRYFLWNFVGRQNDIQNSYGENEYGNWITGISAIDDMRLGDQELLPDSLKNNKGRNVYFALPLILGIIGIIWQLANGRKGKQQFSIVLLLFFMTGLAIVLYLNQYPLQPRERDYAYAGSFYAFAIWIGMGVAGIAQFIGKILEKRKLKSAKNTLKRFIDSGIDKDTAAEKAIAESERIMEWRNLIANSIVAALCLLIPLQMASQNWDDHDRSGRYACRDFGLNYLNTLPKEGSPIIFTCGDNDTFPLWYNQEVEGERTDARVCNLSYLQTDWYIDQMRRPAYDSPSLPITWNRLGYAGNNNQSVLVIPMEEFIEEYRKEYPERYYKAFGDNPYEMNKITKHWILEANATEKSFTREVIDEIITLYERAYNQGVSRKERIEFPRNIIPTETLYIPIDAEAVLRSGMIIPEEYAYEMPEYMTIDISDRAYRSLIRYELIILDMIANANWERPIYMSMTVGDSNYPSVLKNFFVHEGLAYRITPFNWSELGYKTENNEHPVDIDKFYHNVMNRFKWGGIKEHKDYYADETIRRMVATHRNLVAQLATDMLNSGEPDKEIFALLEKAYTELPNDVVPYDALRDNSLSYANIYDFLCQEQSLGDDTLKLLKERRNEIANITLKDELEYLQWYNTLKGNDLNDIMLYHRTSLVSEAWRLLENGEYSKTVKREEIVKTLCDLLNKEVDLLEKTGSNSDAEVKKAVVGQIYNSLIGMELTDKELRSIEGSVRKLLRK